VTLNLNGEAPPRRRIGMGYGAIALILAAIVVVMVGLPMLSLIDAAPAVVTDQDIADLQASQRATGVSATQLGAGRMWGRGMSICTRDNAFYQLAQFLHLPRPTQLRIEYSMLTDCQPRHG
jgi:hypothetical protein